MNKHARINGTKNHNNTHLPAELTEKPYHGEHREADPRSGPLGNTDPNKRGLGRAEGFSARPEEDRD